MEERWGGGYLVQQPDSPMGSHLLPESYVGEACSKPRSPCSVDHVLLQGPLSPPHVTEPLPCLGTEGCCLHHFSLLLPGTAWRRGAGRKTDNPASP